MTDHAVLIVGAGPTGMMLAAELALARIDVALVEKRESATLDGSRAGGLHARSLELLEQRGVAGRFVAEGNKHPAAFFGQVPLDLSDLPTRFNFVLGLWQKHIERLLADWVAELEVPIYRGREVSEVRQDDDGVDITLSSGAGLRAHYVVGCDGGRSSVRKQVGIELAGWAASTSFLIAEASTSEEPAWGMRRDEKGTFGIGKLEDGKRMRAVLREERVGPGEAPSLDELRAALVALYGTDYGVHDVTWLSRFTDATLQAKQYRSGRVLLAGDAAHVHSPVGGQGLNTGLHDAVNLGWKLAQVVRGTSPEALLDTYHAERHPVAARILRNTMAMTALTRGDDRMEALRETVTELLSMPAPRERYAAELCGIDVHYDLGSGHPLLGRRMPDLELLTDDGTLWTSSLLHAARAVLLDFGRRESSTTLPWAETLRTARARPTGPWKLPVVGEVAAPSAVLIRPDGYVAWVGEGSDDGLSAALTRWFGAPSQES
jgi:3-(3-hydroxy-phenyl)propionate hydroxylase